jgi:hypothetical protein
MDVGGQSQAPAALLPRKKPLIPIGQEAGCVLEPFWNKTNGFAAKLNVTEILTIFSEMNLRIYRGMHVHSASRVHFTQTIRKVG